MSGAAPTTAIVARMGLNFGPGFRKSPRAGCRAAAVPTAATPISPATRFWPSLASGADMRIESAPSAACCSPAIFRSGKRSCASSPTVIRMPTRAP
jgi:hypothetical protein